MQPWQAQQLSQPKQCHGPWRINIFILTQCKYLVNIHPNGTGYSMGTAPNLESTTLKSAIEKQGCLYTYHFVLSLIVIPFLLSLLFPLSPNLTPALIPAHLDCCFGFSVDFPGLQSRPPQAILQTSTEQKSLYSPSTDSRSLLACQSKPPACPSGPTTVCLQQISILLLPPCVASLTQREIYSSQEAVIHTCLCSHRPPQQKALRLPCYTPEPL